MASKKPTKPLRPGSFKSGTSARKTSTRRTGRTAGMSQSAFAGYGFQGNQPAVASSSEPPADKAGAESVDDTVEEAGEQPAVDEAERDAEASGDPKD